MAKPAPSRVAAALNYLERLKNQTAEFGGGVVENLADRARSVGELAYEALTSDPAIGRMTTAEFAQAADRPTPRLDQAARDIGTIGRAIVTQPIQTGKAIVQGEVERAREAMSSPRAAGEYAGSFIDPMRMARMGMADRAPQRIAQALEAAPTVPKKVTQKSLEKQLKAVDPNASLVKTVVFDGQGNRKPMYIARVNNKSVEIGSHLDDVETWAQESLEGFANQRKAASINAELGLPETAQTGLWVVQGVDPQGNPFSMERARKAAEKIRFRHEQTNYDDMLQQGISKEEARGDVLAMFNRLKASK